MHILEKPGAELKHYEFLHDKPTDPRPDLIKKLIEFCGDQGNIIVYYQPFEKTRNKEMAEAFPEHADDLLAINDRIVDLTKYNPGHRGLITMTENNHLIVRAFSLAWKYRNLYEKIENTDIVIEQEKTSWRNFYKYMTLAYLSPKIINALMSGKLNMPLRDVYELASKSQDFSKQERLFFNRTQIT